MYTLALDIGTSSIRAAAVTADGQIAALRQVPFMPVRKASGFSQYQGDIIHCQLDVLNSVLEEVGPAAVDELVLSSQRSTVVLWDRLTGRPLAPVLTWEDGRAVNEAAQNPLSQADVHVLTGLYKTPFFSAPKIAWCFNNFPDVRQAFKENRLCVGPLASFLIFHLTQKKVFATDFTLAQRMLLLDIHTLTWSEKLCTSFDIPVSVLPQLKPSVADYGTYDYKGHLIAIKVCAADQQAASSHLQAGQTCINYGTGAFVLRHIGNKNHICEGLLTSLAPTSTPDNAQFLLEGPVNSAGSAFLWLAKQGISFDMAQLDDLCNASQKPVHILPALGGLGAPYWNFNCSPVIANLSPLTQPADWAAGLTRSIAFLVADIAHYLKQQNAPLEKVFVSGGLSQSRYLVQFQSDLLQLPLDVEKQTQGTLLGLVRLLKPLPTPANLVVSPSVSAADAAQLYKAWRTFFTWAVR